MSKQCRRRLLPNHNWQEWVMFHSCEITKGEGVVGWIFLQKRVCKKCGLTQIEKNNVDINKC